MSKYPNNDEKFTLNPKIHRLQFVGGPCAEGNIDRRGADRPGIFHVYCGRARGGVT
jgi:hypothetical protein